MAAWSDSRTEQKIGALLQFPRCLLVARFVFVP